MTDKLIRAEAVERGKRAMEWIMADPHNRGEDATRDLLHGFRALLAEAQPKHINHTNNYACEDCAFVCKTAEEANAHHASTGHGVYEPEAQPEEPGRVFCMATMTPAEFGIRVAKAMLEIASSNARFVFQQAVQDVPDSEDIESDYGSSAAFLKSLIKQGEAPARPAEEGLISKLEKEVADYKYWRFTATDYADRLRAEFRHLIDEAGTKEGDDKGWIAYEDAEAALLKTRSEMRPAEEGLRERLRILAQFFIDKGETLYQAQALGDSIMAQLDAALVQRPGNAPVDGTPSTSSTVAISNAADAALTRGKP